MAQTQDALYADIDLELSWSERDLPERERTKHVHRLHPYLGKFIPQLVEILLGRYVPPSGRVLDPFAGSGTTLVQSLESGRDAVGVDVAAFNCLLVGVKTARYNEFVLESEVRDILGRFGHVRCQAQDTGYIGQWFAPQAVAQLLAFRSLIDGYEYADVLRIVLARAARSARRTTHFDLDFPRAPQLEPYWCHKHRRTCRPVEEARRFLLRYTQDTLDRLEQFAALRDAGAGASVLHGDARTADLGGPFDAVITSPPYPGLIDYHEQHRYAYELLGLEERRSIELGRPATGVGREAIRAYVDGVADVLANARSRLAPGAPVCVVVNDRRGLYSEILGRARLRLDERLERHVNRRTGRRAGEYFESILICRAA